MASAIYAEALELLIEADRTDDEITARLDHVLGDLDSALDPAVAVAQSEALRDQW